MSIPPVASNTDPREWPAAQSPRDRLIVLVTVLLITAPLLAYAWVTIDADRDARIGLALGRNQGIARIVARALDLEYSRNQAVLRYIVADPALRAAAARRDTAGVNTALAKTALAAPDLVWIGVYARNHTRIGGTGAAPARLAARAAVVAAARHRLLLQLPLTPENGGAMLAAELPAAIFGRAQIPLDIADVTIYIANEDGSIVFTNSVHRAFSGQDYIPMRLALRGQSAGLVNDSPGGGRAALVGYAGAPVAECGVVVLVPLEAAFAPTQVLVVRLSVLLLPVMLALFTTAWQRLRFARQIEAMARRLAYQNEALRAADRAKSDFLANVSHDLRTPLAAIQVSLSGILDPAVNWSVSEVRETLQGMTRDLERMTARVRNLLTMSRIEAGVDPPNRQPADLTDIVGAALERVAPLTRGREIDADFPPEPLVVDCDQAQVETALINLLENAVKYSPEGTAIHLRGEACGDRAVVTVRDEGPGLQPGEETAVFEKFYRSQSSRSQSGTGLGLAICRAIASAHNGGVGAANVPGGGGEFWLALPLMSMEEEVDA